MENEKSIVISTRVRLARNVSGYPFPGKLTTKSADNIAAKVYDAVKNTDNYSVYKISMLNPVSAEALKERHLISNDLIKGKKGGSVLINSNESLSIMTNEEDHIRAQCILKGFDLKESYRRVDAVDDLISKKVNYCFNDKLGYLTACPTNLGTAMRASVMMFLPGLTITDSLERCVNSVGRYNIAVRGVYGEGSAADGYIYQISNQISLGYSENEILEIVKAVSEHIAESEFAARKLLIERQGDSVRDEILRAYGVAANAYILDCGEMMRLTALIKLGVYYGMLKCNNVSVIDDLITRMQPANLILEAGQPQNVKMDIYRAEKVRETLNRFIRV